MDRKIKNIKTGQSLTIQGIKYHLTEVHDYFVKAFFKNSFGRVDCRCFNIGELVMAGYEPTGTLEPANNMRLRRRTNEKKPETC